MFNYFNSIQLFQIRTYLFVNEHVFISKAPLLHLNRYSMRWINFWYSKIKTAGMQLLIVAKHQ